MGDIIRESLIGGAVFAMFVVALAGVISVLHYMFNEKE